MESKEIKKILKQFNTTNTYKKIFINGTWGIGKSYYTNEYVNENKNNIVYISLFGKSSYEAIENAIAKELMNKLDKIGKLKKNAKQIAKKINGSISLFGVSVSTPEINRKTLIEEFSNTLDNKELIIIIDDLERKSGNILIEDIMGMIEEFATFEKIKIAIIGAEKNIASEDLKKWKKFKEKIIEKEYKITSFSDESLDNLVTKEVNNYIDDEEIENFINNYIKRHNVQNLRTIMKGINLFKEIINNHIQIKNDKKVNLMLLKNCISVAVESTEQIYKPNEENKDKNPFQYAIDEDIMSRIIHHYFNSIYVNNNDSCVLYYVLKIFNSEYDKDTIKDLNDTINGYLNLNVEEKNIFYLSEKQIEIKVNELYSRMKNDKYEFVSLDKFIDDFYEISIWNDVLNLKYNSSEVSSIFNKILFAKFYNIENNLYKNKIDRFELKRRESKSLSDLIDNYNNSVDAKYFNDKLFKMEESFKNGEYAENILEWLDSWLIQDNKDDTIDKFIKSCRKNNFFIPNISGEINENLWRWIHKIWKLFYQRMDEKYKVELNEYAETLKINNLSSYRINTLQEYRPLIKSND